MLWVEWTSTCTGSAPLSAVTGRDRTPKGTMKQFVLLVALTPVWSQSLQILPSPPSSGGAGSFRIMLVSPKDSEPSAVQWRLTVSRSLKVLPGGITAESSAEDAHKTVTCAATKAKDADVAAFVCIVAGGKERIPNGSIALVRFVAEPYAGKIRVSEVLGVTADGKRLPMQDVEAVIDRHELQPE